VGDPALEQLAAWGNYYVIVGSAAGGLTGLMFVVIALAAQVNSLGTERGLSAFASPTIVHFCAVLITAAVIASPGHHAAALGPLFAAGGLVGIVYVAWAMRQGMQQADYTPVRSDWIWHAWVPSLAYAAILGAGATMVAGALDAGLYVLGAATLLLLFTGIHNAWDTAIWIALWNRPGRKPPAGPESPQPPRDAH